MSATQHGPDLLNLLAAEDAQYEGSHMVLPNMSLACGRDLAEVLRVPKIDGQRRVVFSSSETTCPDCLAAGDHGALVHQMQTQQAPVKG